MILEKFQQVIGGLGKVYGPYKIAKNQTKVRWVLSVHGFEKTQAAIAMLWNWLGTEKRQQAISILRRASFHTSR